MWMATRRNDLPYIPILLDRSPRAARLRRRNGVGAALLLLFFSLLAAVGLAELVAILFLLLLASGTAFFLHDRRRREWLWLQLAPVGERAALIAGRLLRSGAVRVGAVSTRGRGLRLSPEDTQRQPSGPSAGAPVDPEALTVEQAAVPEVYRPLPKNKRLRLPVRDVTAIAHLLPQLLPAFRRRFAAAISNKRAGTGERSAISDGDALRCQAFGMRLRRSGHPHRAVPLHRSARLIFAETGNRRGEALAMNGLGLALAAAGEHEAALRQFNLARTLLHEVGDSKREGKVLVNLSLVKRQLGASEEAAELLRAAQAKFAPDTYPYQLAEQHLQQPSPQS
jgi:tetratricopeptide (TPR) repeat protein